MIDLHIHTNYSGGKNNLTKILQIAEKRNISIISITDNNTCEAYEELKELSEKRFYSGKIIPGCEFSTIVNNVPIELIGYNIDTDLAQDKISKLYLPKKDYNIYETNLIIKKCIEKGLVLDVHNIVYNAEEERGKRVVFNEIKRHLENKRFISTEAWDNARTFLLTYTSNPNSDFFVDFSGLIPSYKQVVQLIKQCGGKVFMPHIFKYNENSISVLETLISERMLDGIEGYYPYYSNEQQRFALKFDYLKSINVINENGQTENTNIIYGQIFTINYKKNILTIVDKKIYENHFEKTNEYNFYLNDVGIIEDETKIILNFINQIKQKNDCNFLLYVLSNRKSMSGRQKNNIKAEKEIDSLFKLWNITDKYYSYKQYKIYLNLYEELYIDTLKKNLDINLSNYEKIKEQIRKVKKEILKGD